MFLESTIEKNKKLIETSFFLHQNGLVLPDSYIIDVDTLRENAKAMLACAHKERIALYFMLKQVGRNPYIAKELMKLGYEGAVVVDFKEAALMMKHHIPIANVGHLVQTPRAMLAELLAYGCKYFTMFSLEKLSDLNECAKKLQIKQKVLLKVVGKQDVIYSGQVGGFHLEELPTIIEKTKQMEHIELAGVTSFPCFLYDEQTNSTKPTNNLDTLCKASVILQEHGIEVENINAPSSTSSYTLRQMASHGIHSGEPGHGLTATTPLHAHMDGVEQPCVTYISEVSHNFDHRGYCYGGGYYRRSHIANAFVGQSFDSAKKLHVEPPTFDSIDYYFQLEEPCNVNDTVIMAFRYQMFVTRSNVVLIEGIHEDKLHIIGTYTSLGVEVE